MNDYFALLDFILNPALNTSWRIPRASRVPRIATHTVDIPSPNEVNMPAIKSVIFNKNATIVYFEDGTRSIVRKSVHDEYNREHAVVYAIVKRAYGKIGKDGIVEGCGMGNMLSKVVNDGYDQEAHNIEKRAKRDSKHGTKTEKCDATVKPWPTYNAQKNRDANGRFVKKANRK